MSRSSLAGRMGERTYVDTGHGDAAAGRPPSVAEPLRRVDRPALRDDGFLESPA
jgi:hypothetical protein